MRCSSGTAFTPPASIGSSPRQEVAKMTMYRHFPNKDGLIVEVLNYRALRVRGPARPPRGRGPITPQQKIATIFDWYQRWFQRPDFHGCLFANALAEFGDFDHPVFKAVAEQKNGLKRRMRRILEETMPRDQAESVAAALLMLIEGAPTLMAQMEHGATAIRACPQGRFQRHRHAGSAKIDTVVVGLGPRPGSSTRHGMRSSAPAPTGCGPLR